MCPWVMGHADGGSSFVVVPSSKVYQVDKISYHSHEIVLTLIYQRQKRLVSTL